MFVVNSSQYAVRSQTSIKDISFVNGYVNHDIESQEVIYLNVPRTKRTRFEQRSLAVAGPQLWTHEIDWKVILTIFLILPFHVTNLHIVKCLGICYTMD